VRQALLEQWHLDGVACRVGHVEHEGGLGIVAVEGEADHGVAVGADCGVGVGRQDLAVPVVGGHVVLPENDGVGGAGERAVKVYHRGVRVPAVGRA